MSRTRYEWTILDFAIWFAGAVVVPVYDTSSAEQIDWILNDSATVAIIVETPTLRELVQSVLPSHTKHIWTMTEDVLSTLKTAGAHIGDDEIDRRRSSLVPDTLATLIYTSGTTGKPKGVGLTHGNFLAECGNVVQAASDLFLKPGGSTLLFLPVAHVFGRMVEIGAIAAGLHLAHCSDPAGRLAMILHHLNQLSCWQSRAYLKRFTTVPRPVQRRLAKEKSLEKPPMWQLHIRRAWIKAISPYSQLNINSLTS